MMSIWLLETCRELEQTNIRKRIVLQVGYLKKLKIYATCFGQADRSQEFKST